jgi:cysteine desulfurase
MIYLDNNATTAVAPAVRDVMLPFLGDIYANPSSSYAGAEASRKAIAGAREKVAALIGTENEDEVFFTSGGTESDNWAILGALAAKPDRRHIVTTRVEHDAVRKLCLKLEAEGYRVTWLDVDETGSLDLDELARALSPETAIVSVMLANNETGVLFPAAEIGAIVKNSSNALFHIDAVAAAGKIPISVRELSADLVSLSAHKFHGPKGVGSLYVKDGTPLSPLFTGGGQQGAMRSGTEALHQIAGLGAAAEFAADVTPMDQVNALRNRLENEILQKIPNSRLNGTSDPAKRLPNTSSISFENVNGEMILHRLDELGICVSTGSACNAADHAASHVLEAMDVPYSFAMGSIRFSLGRFNTDEDIDRVIEVLPGIVAGLRRIAGARAD